MEKEQNTSYTYLAMFGHMFTDINQGAVPAMLPFLVAATNINYAAAAGLVFAVNFVSAFVQPLFGLLGDKYSAPWLMSVGVLLAGTGLTCIGYVNQYWMIFLCMMLTGVGIAIFHPEGGRLANMASGAKKGTGMSNFAVGGSLGGAFGPIIAAYALTRWGMKGSFVFFIPAVFMAAVILCFLKPLKEMSKQSEAEKQIAVGVQGTDNWPAFIKLAFLLVFRASVYYGLITFVPLYWVDVLHQSETAASSILVVYSVAAAVATVISGRLADRYGFKWVIRASFFCIPPALILFILSKNAVTSAFLLVLLAISISSSYSPLIALGQSFLPGRVGFATGITLGVTISIGGLIAPGIGWIGDRHGLPVALCVVAAIAAIALLLCFRIPTQSVEKANG